MAKKKIFGIPKKLSEGIGETISIGNNNVGQLRFEIVSLSRIMLDPENPRDLSLNKQDVLKGIEQNDPNHQRKQAELESLRTLTHSIKKAGVRNPVELYKEGDSYTLISGERRVLASVLADKIDIPAKILDSKPDELQLRLLQWIENIEREDLNIWERLHNIEQLIEAYSNSDASNTVNSDLLSEIIGCSRKQSKRYLDVISCPRELRERLKDKGITDLIKLSMIANVRDKGQQEILIEEAVKGASRENLSKVLKNSANQKNTQTSPEKKKRGRPVSSIAFKVSLDKTSAIKKVVDYVLNDERYSKYDSQFKNVDWSNAKHIKKALQAVFDILGNVSAKSRGGN